MKAHGASAAEMEAALRETNKEFDDNVEFKRFDITRNFINFTLKVKNSSGPGARRSTWNRHKMISACWHVHGTFFDKLFEIAPDARITTSMGGRREITRFHGNWEDANIGSQVRPCYASEACECDG